MNRVVKKVESKIALELSDNKSLFIGDSGILLCSVLNERNNIDFETVANDILTSEFENSTFCSGKAGINWLFAFLLKNYDLIDSETLSLITKDNQLLKEMTIKYFNNSNWDFMHGALGISYYFLYDENKLDREYHQEVVNILFSQFDRDKVFHIKRKYNFNPNQDTISLGLSHGLPSIIRYLGECYKYNIESKKVLHIINGLKSIILKSVNKNNAFGNIPSMISDIKSSVDNSSRLAWCYGDVGVGISLYNVGKIIQDSEMIDFSNKILLDSTKRKKTDNTKIVDAGICHGSSGVAHIYNKMWNYTNDKRFKEATDYWMEKTLDFAINENNKYQFKKYNSETKKYEINHSLLEGNAGVGLVLYSCITGDCSWDYCLMLND